VVHRKPAPAPGARTRASYRIEVREIVRGLAGRGWRGWRSHGRARRGRGDRSRDRDRSRVAGLRSAFAPLAPPHAESASIVANAAPVIRSNAPLAQQQLIVAASHNQVAW